MFTAAVCSEEFCLTKMLMFLIAYIPSFAAYFKKRFMPSLSDFVHEPARRRNEPAQWTNNNANSINNVLKAQVCLWVNQQTAIKGYR